MRLRLAALVLAVTGASCFEVTEELSVRSDGSGSLAVEYHFGPQFVQTLEQSGASMSDYPGELRSKVEPRVAARSNLSAFELTHRNEGRDWFVTMSVEVGDVAKLTGDDVAAFFCGSDDAREVELSIQPEGDGFRFHRATRVTGGSAGTPSAFASLFAGMEYVVRLRGGSFVEHDGELVDDGTAVEWRFDMGRLATEPTEMTAVFKPSGSSDKNNLLWGIVGALGLTVVGVGSFLAGRAKPA